jgi:hypothetical protein
MSCTERIAMTGPKLLVPDQPTPGVSSHLADPCSPPLSLLINGIWRERKESVEEQARPRLYIRPTGSSQLLHRYVRTLSDMSSNRVRGGELAGLFVLTAPVTMRSVRRARRPRQPRLQPPRRRQRPWRRCPDSGEPRRRWLQLTMLLPPGIDSWQRT